MAIVFIDDFELDAAVVEDHTFDSEVTEYPVEKGADVADHVRARPIVVTIEGIVSDTPVGSLAERRFDQFGEFLYSGEAFTKLQEIRDAREPVRIITSLRSYDNMLLQSIQVPRDARTGDALRFRATFVQLQLVTNARTVIRTAQPRGQKKRDLGSKPTFSIFSLGKQPAPSVDPNRPAPRQEISAISGEYVPSGKPFVTAGSVQL